MDYRSREQAELVSRVANLGLSGELKLPEDPKSCISLLKLIDERLERVRIPFEELAKSRSSDDRVRDQLVEALLRWFVLGRDTEKLTTDEASDEEGR